MATKTIGQEPSTFTPQAGDYVLIQRGLAYFKIAYSDLVSAVAGQVGAVMSGHGNPVAPPPAGVTAAKYTDLDTSSEWYWDKDNGPAWFQQA